MRKKTKQIMCILLMLGILLTSSYHGEITVRAVNASDSLYKWHRAMSVEELKTYMNAEGEETDYKGCWVPIIIVAEYADGTQYYINRYTRLAIRDSEAEYIPVMNDVSSSDVVGSVLKNGIKSGKDFVSKGDLGAMHMYYHGEQSASYLDIVPTDYGALYLDTNVTSEVWSLTKDEVADYSNATPSTVYGLQYHNPWYSDDYVALDQNNVKNWKGTSGLPETYSPLDDDTYFDQGWTFFDDNREGYFLISNLFNRPNNESFDFEAATWGCALSGSSRFSSPNKEKRYLIETPSRAAADMVDSYSYVGGSRYKCDVLQENMKDKILEQYESKYDEQETRVRFKIYIGERIKGDSILKSGTIENRTDIMGTGNTLPKGAKLTVKKGATIIIPEGSWLLLDGTIENEGTIIVEKNAVIGSTVNGKDCTDNGGVIICKNGGQLLVMEDAHVYLSKGLILQNNGQVINKGLIVIYKLFTMEGSQIQLANQGRLAVGFAHSNASVLYTQDFSGSFDQRFQKNVYNSTWMCYDAWTGKLWLDENSKIIMEKTSAVDLSYYMYLAGYRDWLERIMVGLEDGEEQTSLSEKYIKTKRAHNEGWRSYNSHQGEYVEYVY